MLVTASQQPLMPPRYVFIPFSELLICLTLHFRFSCTVTNKLPSLIVQDTGHGWRPLRSPA